MKAIMAVDTSSRPKKSKGAVISFSDEDYHGISPNHDDPLVISAVVANVEVRRVFVDQGSSADIMFYELFKKLDFAPDDLLPFSGDLVGFTGARILPAGYVEARVTLGESPLYKSVTVKFLVVDCPSAYNIILGRPSLNNFGAVVSTPHLTLKFPTKKGEIVTIRGDQKVARSCYLTSLKSKETATVEKGDKGKGAE